MAREPSKGPLIQKRVKRLLAALLCFAAGEFAEDNFNIEYDWKEEDSANPKLTIKTTLVTLELLTQKDKDPGKLTKTQIREALNLLKDFAKILEDNRIQTQGSDEWHFTLKLWSTDKEKNLKQFDEEWENKRPKKSKELEANYTQDEGVADVPQSKLAIFQAPPLPAHFVERPEYSDDLKTRLLTEDNRTLVITAIHGLGSVGKSTLAAALAVDAEIQTRFCDGILWATLGQQPDVLSLVSGWVQALGDYSFKPTSVEATTNHLRTLLYNKAVLLVVDDAWNTQDAQAFNVGGVRCQVLVTTREGAIADALAASTYSLDIMKPNQAMELLTKKLRREITGAERQLAENLAKGVGYLPLALELAAAEVACGTTWDELLSDIQQEVARLRSFDRPEAEEITDEASLKRLSLTASLNLSVKRMPQEKQQHFAWLGVLPEDVNINKMIAATLWAMDERDAAKTLQYLRNKALLLTGVPLADGTPTYRLHDLFHDLACNLLTATPQPKRIGDLPGLGLNLADAHAALWEKYRQKTQNNLWHTLPNDGYIHQRLVWHLEKAGRVEEIHSLLHEESATGNNGWFEVREKLGQTGGYITDISRAWELAEAIWDESSLPQVVGWQCRYALITASVNSLATKLPVKLLMALVKNNMWTPEQGLAYAVQNPEAKEKVTAIAELVNYLPPNLEKLALSEALTAARSIQDEYYRADALSALAANLPPELLAEALTAARSIQDEYYRACALSALAANLPEVLPEALTATRSIQDEYYRADALSVLAANLPPELLAEALTAARLVQDEYYRASALSALAANLPPELLAEALTAARSIQDEYYRACALSALAANLPPELLAEALTAARSIQDEYYRASALSALAANLPEVSPEALTTARLIQDEYNRADALSALAEKLPEVLPEALTAARLIQDEYNRADALSTLAAKLPEVLPEALTAARLIQDEYNRADTLRALAANLPPELLAEALTAARSIKSNKYRADALSALAAKLPEVLPEALIAARSIKSNKCRADALRALAANLPPELLAEALTAARSIQDEYYRASALSALAANLPPELLAEALTAARSIQDEYYRASALSALAANLPEVLPEALITARSIKSNKCRADALRALAANLPPELLAEALTAARSIKSNKYRASALRALAANLPPELLAEALTAARSIKSNKYRADALRALAANLPEVLPEALTAARSIQDEYYRANTLRALAANLPEVLPEALTAARSIQDEYYRANTLRALAANLPEVLPEALTAARSIKSNKYRADALRALAEKLPEVLPEALTAARSIQDEYYRVDALSALAANLPPELLAEALTAARSIQNEYYRADALSALAANLPEVVPEALIAARLIEPNKYRADALRALAANLPPELLAEALTAARLIKSNKYRADALSALAVGLSQMSSATLFPLWQDTLHQLSLRTRPNLLQSIKALFPVIFALGGEVAMAEVAHAIADVGRWWK
ncbi:NB-ARC domain-containing protein [Calothrix sp. NIES-2098]|uniref:NB-ARC domain-containing protein n=1 Tax=Calothrix sp. NIES-2098 TaxID=1954171 RepID=UPI000B5FAEAE|nr:regulatory protein [Calothrix sp. NIES-2098]